MWISYNYQENKQDSMQQKDCMSPHVKKIKQFCLQKKVLASAYWSGRDALLIEYLSNGNTVNADKYYEYLSKLRQAIQNKHQGLPSYSIIFLQNKMRRLVLRSRPKTRCKPSIGKFQHIYLVLQTWCQFLSSERFSSDGMIQSMSDWLERQAITF